MLPLNGDNAYFLELYSRYRRDRCSVPADWCVYFETMDGNPDADRTSADDLAGRLVEAYRRDGHLEADLDPLGLETRGPVADLVRLRAAAQPLLGRSAQWSLGGKLQSAPLSVLLARLGKTYAGTCALQAGHIDDGEARLWIQEEYERLSDEAPGVDALARACEAVALADAFETFVKTKYPTKKRFGIEGSEGSSVILREVLRRAALAGCGAAVIGGMHRGRLATLATVLGKPLATLIAETVGRDLTDGGPDYTGDVPYHLGHAAELTFDGARLRVQLAPHPSHLTVVAPVAMGLARARRAGAPAALSVLMHTDAAFSGQGLVSELMQLSGLDGYQVGGSIHIVVNNQIGFTTLPSEGRTATYCTDIAKMIGAPVLHVNGDDPQALIRAAALAFAWRSRFGRDVIIDLVCYRRNGHNELDEPRFTQPRMWRAIDARPTLASTLLQRLRREDRAAGARVAAAVAGFHDELVAAYAAMDRVRPNLQNRFQQGWEDCAGSGAARLTAPVGTGVSAGRLRWLAQRTTEVPAGMSLHPKIEKFHETRLNSVLTGEGINFATAEALAFASLLDEGRSVRLSGQDAVRGTFTQRHHQVHDMETGATAMPIRNAARDGARFEAINSPLSEYGVLSFEYGHSLDDPRTLTLWEAQFGDFLNGAQIAVDQFITSAEAKWQLKSGLVLLLPHGLEGQGPDHSSARIERLLQLCANGNMIVANPTTPANHFHLLRRQQHAGWRVPLFVIAPKALLRARAGQSSLAEFDEGTSFRPVILDPGATGDKAGGAIFCSGKICYDLLAARAEAGLDDRVAIHRVEQLYPLDTATLVRTALQTAAGGGALVWCQEEPENQGAWPFLRQSLSAFDGKLHDRLTFVGRPPLPVAAGGSVDRHVAEQAGIVERALRLASGSA